MLGEEYFDEQLISDLVQDFKKDSGMDLSDEKLAMQRLCDAAEKAKRCFLAFHFRRCARTQSFECQGHQGAV